MALTHDGRDTGQRANTTESRLLRRLVITCPVTGLATDTGFELSDLPAVVTRQQLLVDCLECGQDHSWHIGDAVLER